MFWNNGHLALYKLTGGKSWATDYTNASRTMLFDINKKQWDDELLDHLIFLQV